MFLKSVKDPVHVHCIWFEFDKQNLLHFDMMINVFASISFESL